MGIPLLSNNKIDENPHFFSSLYEINENQCFIIYLFKK